MGYRNTLTKEEPESGYNSFLKILIAFDDKMPMTLQERQRFTEFLAPLMLLSMRVHIRNGDYAGASYLSDIWEETQQLFALFAEVEPPLHEGEKRTLRSELPTSEQHWNP